VRILVLGSGGREHALVWRLASDPDVTGLMAAPGNPGIAKICRCLPADLQSPEGLLALADRERADLTVVGPEAPLELGVADLFRAHGRLIVGPPRGAAALECSKVWSKQFMARHGIPTAPFVVAADLESALEAVAGPRFGFPVVIKADGLAAGKGVVVAESREEAEHAVKEAMVDRRFGAAGARLVVEACLTGPEVSSFFLCDGQRAVPLSTAQDHKRIWDDDRGPNTGGMGAFAPSPLADAALSAFVERDVVEPVLRGMRAEGQPYVGFLYAGLMLTGAGPRVIEFNVRFGDPEAQVVLPLLEGAFARALADAAEGRLVTSSLRVGSDRHVGVVIASRGYPHSSESGRVIEGLERAAAVPGALVFHSGTTVRDGQVVTAGGRVLTVVGRGADYEQAIAAAYQAVQQIHFDGMQFRRDIGRKALVSVGGE
jgi:phosphoribosylamine--glycine ligase